MRRRSILGKMVVICLTTMCAFAPAEERHKSFQSHPPTRPLPVASKRPMSPRRGFYVDPKLGKDSNEGTNAAPWKTVQHAVDHISAGDVVYLREGIYYENVIVKFAGSREKPITLRSFPGELAILDGALRQFAEKPGEVWEPTEGASHEFRSVQKFPQVDRVVGNFGDSLVPLHGYREAASLRAKSESPLQDKSGERKPFYLGPGLWYDSESQRIHVRLAHTHIKAFGADNYRGETDPRRLPLIVTPWNSTPLTLQKASHVRIHDLVIRGGGDSTILIRGCKHVEFDGVTVYALNRGMRVETTGHLRVVNCAIRGTMPPWGSRTASKYAAVDSHLFVPVGTHKIERDQRKYLSPQCHDFEIAHCEFTDGHDGVYVGGVQRLKFRHNLLDNMNDDGVYLSAWGPPGSDVQIYQNYLSRCLTVFAFGLGRGSESDPGKGTYICRNIIDLRAPVPYGHPLPDTPELTSYGRLCGDHGGPIWEPLNFYHNTVVSRAAPYRGYYAAGWGGHMRGTKRRLFNNIFVQVEGLPGLNFESPDIDMQAGGNLHWSLQDGPNYEGDFFGKFRSSSNFSASKKTYKPGWTTDDVFADPKLRQFASDWHKPLDISVANDSPAIDAGVQISNDWYDPLRSDDNSKPDIGAIPLGGGPLKVGRQEQ